MISAK
jgi:hypothetical protein